MQADLQIPDELQVIEIDVLNDERIITSLSCDFETNFHELHTKICEAMRLHPQSLYRFYLPKLKISLRALPRSRDDSGTKRLLSLLTVGDDIVYQNHNRKLRLMVRSIGRAIEGINIERDMRKVYASLESSVTQNAYKKRNRIQRDNLTLLYGLAADLLAHSITRLFHDQASLVFNLKGNHLLSYCYISQSKDRIEYFFFPDRERFSRYVMIKQDAYLPVMHKDKYKDGMAMVFSKRQLKETDFTKPYNAQLYVEHACYAYFYDVKRGFEVDTIGANQSKELMRYLVALQKALPKLIANQSKQPANASLYIGYNPHTKQTLLQYGPKPLIHLNDRFYENSANLSLLAQFRKTVEVIELDYFLCMRQPTKNKDERCVYLAEGVVIGKAGRRLRSEPYENDDRLAAMMIDLLLDIMEVSGLPQQVMVRERCVYSYVHDFCKQLGIEVAIYARLPKIDAYHQSRIKK